MKYLVLILLSFASIISIAQTKSDAQLIIDAEVIRNETTPGGNTRGRIADMYEAIINNKPNKTTTVNGHPLSSNVTITKDDISGLDDATVFQSDVTFVLSGGKSFGKYTNGQTAAWTGLTVIEALQDAAVEYINPAFSAFSISGQSTTVEVGTTLSGSKTFTWTLAANSGVVSTIDLYNNTTSSTLLAGTPNDGSQAQTITTVQLNSNGATQSWKGIGNNTSPTGTVNSSNFVVTGRYYRFWGTAVSNPASSSDVRSLSSSAFHTGASSFTLATGTTAIKFVVGLPPGVTISSVIDTGNLNADITSSFVLIGTVNVLDAGSTNRAYNIYVYDIGAPYPVSSNLTVTTAN